jgi:hypothetical protein
MLYKAKEWVFMKGFVSFQYPENNGMIRKMNLKAFQKESGG